MTTPYSPGGSSKPLEHSRSSDSMSVHSNSPLRSTTYPPLPSQQASSSRESLRASRHVRLVDSNARVSRSMRNYDTDSLSSTAPIMPQPGQSSGLQSESRSGSWDLLAGNRKFEHSYEEFDARNARHAHSAFAEGDIPNNGVSVVFLWDVQSFVDQTRH